MRFLATLALFTTFSSCSGLLAFPGAEGESTASSGAFNPAELIMFATGFGAQSTGGRGGSVYVVSNLNDSGAGSLRDAVSQSNRIVVFAVGGLITISDRIVVSSHVTIAGQTAPGQGITVYGNGISYSGASDAGKDAITIANGENMIFDHVSVSWGRDETFSINGDVTNVTISDSIIAQGLETHSCGGLIQTDGGVSIIRSLYIDNKTRNPKVKGVNEFVNNVVYNWGSGGGYIAGDSAGPSYANILNNVFISQVSLKLHFKASILTAEQDGTLNGWILSETTDNYSDVDFQATKYDYPTVSTLLDPLDALNKVMLSAGASKSRDHVDTYLIQTELGSYGKVGTTISDPTASPINGPGPISGGTAPVDTDGDGIPDDYEKAHGTDPNVNDSANLASNGYANIENYVNSLV
ncbi:hypothetical protein H0H93_011693 [Arthromyces matolae]|nr:hypothetical protein H0H93_011693 [Arthromyces matolae]